MSKKLKSLRDLQRKDTTIDLSATERFWMLKLVRGRMNQSNGDGLRVLRKTGLIKRRSFELTQRGETAFKQLTEEINGK